MRSGREETSGSEGSMDKPHASNWTLLHGDTCKRTQPAWVSAQQAREELGAGAGPRGPALLTPTSNWAFLLYDHSLQIYPLREILLFVSFYREVYWEQSGKSLAQGHKTNV